MAKCLVLGANGFIASHLVDALTDQENEVVAFGRFGKDPQFKSLKNVKIVHGDFLNKNDLVEALQGADYVFHFISTTTPATAENDPLIDVETNIRMSIELFQACVDAGVKRVIFASTGGAIYGQGDGKPFKENDTPYPISPYAIGKLTIEHYLRYFKVKHGLDSVVFRISNPYGERQPLHSRQGVIPVFLENILRDKPLTVLGDGSMVRDYIYVKDVAKMIANVFNVDLKSSVYNIGSGEGHTINQLVECIERTTGKQAIIEHKPAPSTFVHKVVLDTSQFQEEFRTGELTGLENGLLATYNYIKQEINNP